MKERARENIREQQELYQFIAENSQDIITYIDSQGVTQYVSPVVKKLLGYEPQEVIGTVTFDFYHPEDKVRILNSNFFLNSDEGSFTCRIRHKKGHYVWFETTVKAIRDETGSIQNIFGIGRDITKRKEAEDELRKAKLNLESFIQNNADAIWVIDLSEHVVEVNTAFEKMFGWKSEEVIGQYLPIIPEVEKESMVAIHKKVKSGQSIIGFETTRVRKNGSFVHVSATLSPLLDVDGRIVGVTGVCRDINEKVYAEKILNETKELLESFLDHHVDAIVIFNKDGKVIRVNEAFEKMLGWTSQEVLGDMVVDLKHIPIQTLEETYNIQKRIQAGEAIQEFETTRIRKNGTILNVSLSAFPILDSNRKSNGWSFILRDITEWKKTQEFMQNSEKLTVAGQLAAGIAHEIRNPITAISGFVQLMQAGVGEKQQYFDIMTSEIKRIEMIISELLVLSKPQLIKFKRSDILRLIHQVTTLLGTQAILNNVEIVTEFSDTTLFVDCDENQIKQAFINFIKNAIEAMPNGGKLTIQIAGEDKGHIVIRFIDEGCGIPEHVLSKLGRPFYTTKEKGTGLGYMISMKIIGNHNGNICIQSELNKGTTIELRLPIAQ